MKKSFQTAMAALLSFCSFAPAQAQPVALSEFEAGSRAHLHGDIRLAIAHFQLGAARADPRSLFALATYFHLGQGVAQDYDRARALLEESAAQGAVEAKAFLGIVYRNGEGVPADKARAMRYLGEAATLRCHRAQIYLAEMLYTGEGVPAAQSEALAWLYVAAANGGKKVARARARQIEKELPRDAIRVARQKKVELERILPAGKSRPGRA